MGRTIKIGVVMTLVIGLLLMAIAAHADTDEAPVYRHLGPDVVCVKPKDGEEKCYQLQSDQDSQSRRKFYFNYEHDYCGNFGPDGRPLFNCEPGDPLMAIATKGKTPRARVVETFQTFQILPQGLPQIPKVIGPNKRAVLRLPPSSARYEFHHDVWHWSGKAIFHQECPFDSSNDPGEASCRLVWAAI